MQVLRHITEAVTQGKKLFALLIDPEKCDQARLSDIAQSVNASQPDLLLVGGSQLQTSAQQCVSVLKQKCAVPVVLFPGNCFQLATNADALWLLSLLSGRNAEWLVGQQVCAAKAIYQSGIEAIPTGYILIDGGRETAVQRVSQTLPIDANAIDLAVSTALCGEQAGKKLIYLEAGSGALHPVPLALINAVKKVLSIPLIVGGGITSSDVMRQVYQAGADIVVVGNYLEQHLEELPQFVAASK